MNTMYFRPIWQSVRFVPIAFGIYFAIICTIEIYNNTMISGIGDFRYKLDNKGQ